MPGGMCDARELFFVHLELYMSGPVHTAFSGRSVRVHPLSEIAECVRTRSEAFEPVGYTLVYLAYV